MGRIFGLFEWSLQEHAGEDILLSLLDGELTMTQTRRVQKHLERCWTCRARRDELQKAIGRFVAYRREIIAPFVPPPARGRERFLIKLDEVIAARKKPWWVCPLEALRRHFATTMSPMIASALVISAAAILLLVIWQRSAPPISPESLLAKAQECDSQAAASSIQGGVIYQRIEIRTKNRKLGRAIYRDVAGKRKPRAVVLSRDEEVMKRLVESAEVDWQRPLSVEDFEGFRSRQATFSDKVTRTGDSLLTLTTSATAGPIASESLTVSTNDYHPIERTVEMRDNERIQIAELNYAVLGWNEVNEALFEPLNSHESAAVSAMRLPSPPTAGQLDLAELQARLVLNRLNADSVENVEFSRTSAAVQVNGVVESTLRRDQLVSALKQVPHVVPAIFSVEEMNARRVAQGYAKSVKAYSVVGQVSPLELLFQARGRDGAALSHFSEQMLDAAATVKQESRAIADLSLRFSGAAGLGDSGRAALSELIDRHASKLAAALDAEGSLISNDLQLSPANSPVATARGHSPIELTESGGHNMYLCREFISSNGGAAPRAAEAIASDLLASIQQLRTILHDLAGPATSSQITK